MLERIVNSKSRTFLTFCFCFLAGVALASLANKKIDFVYVYLLLFIFVSILIVFWKNNSARFIVFCLLIITAGFARYSLSLPSDIEPPKEKQAVVGYVSAEPDVRLDGVRYVLTIYSEYRRIARFNGKLYLRSGLYPRYKYGDELKVICGLRKPKPMKDFRYDMYLARYGVFTICQNPKIEKIGQGKGNIIFSRILALKGMFARRVNMLWHEPYAGFMAGLLYGYRGGLGSLNELFNMTGVTHIIAISGYNISIVAAILIAICVNLYIPRKKAFWLISAGIVLFVIFAGMSGSVVRAGIMGFLVLLARQLGRINRIGNAMAVTAVLMTLHNPFILVWDAGFQLSFTATLGLVYLSPLIGDRFKSIPNILGFRESFISTISAIMATLPIMLYQFGRLSIAAPIVNLLILWLIPWIMVLGFVSIFLSFVFYPIGEVLAWISWAFMRYVTFIVEWFADFRFTSVDFKVSLWMMVILYFILIYIVLAARKNANSSVYKTIGGGSN